MKRILLVLGLIFATAFPAAALAQSPNPPCVPSGSGNQAAGADVGGLAGALLGNAASGRNNKAAATVGGGLLGALIGAAAANAGDHGCVTTPDAPPAPDGPQGQDVAALYATSPGAPTTVVSAGPYRMKLIGCRTESIDIYCDFELTSTSQNDLVITLYSSGNPYAPVLVDAEGGSHRVSDIRLANNILNDHQANYSIFPGLTYKYIVHFSNVGDVNFISRLTIGADVVCCYTVTHSFVFRNIRLTQNISETVPSSTSPVPSSAFTVNTPDWSLALKDCRTASGAVACTANATNLRGERNGLYVGWGQGGSTLVDDVGDSYFASQLLVKRQGQPPHEDTSGGHTVLSAEPNEKLTFKLVFKGPAADLRKIARLNLAVANASGGQQTPFSARFLNVPIDHQPTYAPPR